MDVNVPNLSSDRVCCPGCGQRAPFTPRGLTDWHTDRAGALCADVFPAYVTARDPRGAARARRP